MAKRIETEDGHYRVRRGKLVKIPDEWVGEVAHPQTIRKRPSKGTAKSRKRTKGKGTWNKPHPSKIAPRHRGTNAEKENET